jgi:hypothetical protein
MNDPFFHINLFSVFINTLQDIIKLRYYCKIIDITKGEYGNYQVDL